MIPSSKAKCTGSHAAPLVASPVKGHSVADADWVGGLCGGPWPPMDWAPILLPSRWRARLGAVVALGCGPNQDHHCAQSVLKWPLHNLEEGPAAPGDSAHGHEETGGRRMG